MTTREGRGDEGGRMTREERIEKAARALLTALDDGHFHKGRADALRAAIAQPPGPAPSMEEVERLVMDLMRVVSAYGKKASAYAEPSLVEVNAAKNNLLSAIRALPDRYAEGWRACLAAVFKETRYIECGGCDGLSEGDGIVCGYCAIGSQNPTAPPFLPTPNPEDHKS